MKRPRTCTHPRASTSPASLLLRLAAGAGLLFASLAPAFAQPDLTGIWRLSERSPWQGFTPTPAANQVVAAFDRAVDDPTMRCVYPGLLRTLESPAPLEIVQQDHQIIMLFEAFHVVRRIYLESPPNLRPDRLPLSRLGYSAARWEGDALVVETTRLGRTLMDDDGFPFGGHPQARVTERYRRMGDRLELEIRVEDPEHLATPATRTAAWTLAPGTMLFEYSCDPARETGWRMPAGQPQQ